MLPKLRDYTKTELRAVLHDPTVDLDKLDAKQCRLKNRERFRQQTCQVVQEHCKGLITLNDYKRAKVVPKKVVEVLFKKLL